MRRTSELEPLDAKLATKKTFVKYGHKIHYRHEDNGTYVD